MQNACVIAVYDFDGCTCAVSDEGQGMCVAVPGDGEGDGAWLIGADPIGAGIAAAVVGLPDGNFVLTPVVRN